MTDTLIVNTGQAESWNGYEGEHWAANDDRYDTVNSGHAAKDFSGIVKMLDGK